MTFMPNFKKTLHIYECAAYGYLIASYVCVRVVDVHDCIAVHSNEEGDCVAEKSVCQFGPALLPIYMYVCKYMMCMGF